MQQYLAQRRTSISSIPAASPIGRLGRSILPSGARPLAKELATTLLLPVEARKAASLLASGLNRLHLGCGATHLPGWINIDLFGGRCDVVWDLRRPLPFPDASVDAAFHEHLIEHLPVSAVLQLTRECARVLKPGGVLRIGVPDFRRYAASYVGKGGIIEELRPGRPTRLLALTELLYEHGHCSMWDAETLRQVCLDAGFDSCEASSYGGSLLGSIDSPNREAETLYVEVVR